MATNTKLVVCIAAVATASLWAVFPAPAQAVCLDESNPNPIHGCSMCYPTYEEVGPLLVPTGYYCLHADP